MLIAINTRFLIKDKLEGIGWFTCETLKRITRNHPEHQFVFFFDRHFSDEFIFSDNITPLVLSPAARHPFLWYYWFEFAVSNCLKKLKPDIFLSTDGYLCLSTKVKSVLVIHDLAFEHYPKHIDYLTRKYYKYFVPKYAKKADRIATVSRFSKEDIIDKYQISSDKIDVVYNGANELYQPLNEKEKLKIRSKYA
ncbi:MAG: glycosyltransferase, partial [Bacteroidetes bacterium]|nr:glycosyltransferase [Bacteroidota bacterium]